MIGDRITDYLHFLKFEKRYSQHTILAYQQDLEQFHNYITAQFEINDAELITHFHIRSWLAGLKDQDNQARTINRKISSLNTFYKYLLRLQLVKRNPVSQLHALRTAERLPTYIKENEAQYLLEEVAFDEGFKGATDRLICELLYQTGMRRAELLGLKEQSIEWSLGQVRILGKGNKERLVPIGAALQELIKNYIEDKKSGGLATCDNLLVLENGQPLYEGYVYRTVKKYLTVSTTLSKKSPHVLRHSFATHLLNNGANIQAIKDLLGHSSLAATQVYTHNNIEKLKEIHKANHPRG
ncbi:MAG: integrase [Sphingobacteriales bacterium]|nr:MAG: integrase [Sphingobacteriales bacterium]